MTQNSSVIIHDLHVARTIVFPTKTDSPLRVDPYAVSSDPAAPQRLQPVAPQARKVRERFRAVQIGETASSLIGEPLERSDAVALEETPDSAVLEASDHPTAP